MAINYVKKNWEVQIFFNPLQCQPNEKLYKYIYTHTFYFRRNLLTIAIFYGLPVVQLVYINQRVSI